jgi:GT2 family glycosyltransferase
LVRFVQLIRGLTSSASRSDSMNEPVQISVVLAVYNASAHLPSLLSSLLNQSEVSLEVIAVDDGSTDDSLAVLRNAARTDSRLIALSQSHGGCSAARNRGLKAARGRWLAFVDSDDWLMPDTLQVWRQRAETAHLDMLVGNGFLFIERPNETNNPLLKHQPWDEVISGAEWIVRAVATREWPHYVWLQLVRRHLVMQNQLSFIEGIAHQDIAWTLRLALVARRVGFAREPLYGYRSHPASVQGDPSNTAILRRARGYLHVIPQLTTAAICYPRGSPLRRALLRHANRESGYFMDLVRKRLRGTDVRGDVAYEFFNLGLGRAMFRGVTDGHDLWRALRCWIILRRLVMTAAYVSLLKPK